MGRVLRGVVHGLGGLAMLVLGGCASTSGPTEPHDPFESFNRSMFSFNKVLDDAVFGPVAHGYVAVTPEPAREAVFNFFDNLAYLTTVVNQFLQGKVERGFEDTGRFIVNSTFGLAGLIDFASGVGIPRHDEDFGQTLAVWGVEPGPYLVLPLIGPSGFRDAVGIGVNRVAVPSSPYSLRI